MTDSGLDAAAVWRKQMKQAALPPRELAILSYSMMGREAPQYLGTPINPVPKICCQITFEHSNEKADSLKADIF